MGKRSTFDRIDRDFYRTFDKRAVPPLMPFINPASLFWEPCAGAGDLIDQLEEHGHTCTLATDIEPMRDDIVKADALGFITNPPANYIITNPPWSRPILHDMIVHFKDIRPTWLLFDAGWAHTAQAAPYLKFCHTIISLPRLKWIEGSKHTGKDDCAWYGFSPVEVQTVFIGRS